MTDTDKLKRLAEELKDVVSGKNEHGYLFVSRLEAKSILALIAENERLREEVDTQRRNASYANQLMDQRVTAMLTRCEERDEAVSLLRPLANMATVCGKGGDGSVYVGQSGIRLTYGDFRRSFAFLARIDGGV